MIVRVGDKFDAGAIITIPGITSSEKVKVKAVLVTPKGTTSPLVLTGG
jgi:hypothetical protein